MLLLEEPETLVEPRHLAMPIKPKIASFIGHLGLGDLICTCAIAQWLVTVKYYDKVNFPCRECNYESVKSFFLLTPQVDVYAIQTKHTIPQPSQFKHDGDVYVTGYYAQMDRNIDFCTAFYNQLNLP